MKSIGRNIEDVEEVEREPLDEIDIAGMVCTIYMPTPGQLTAMLVAMESEESEPRMVANLLTFIGDLLEGEVERAHIRKALRAGALDAEEIIDLAHEIAQVVGRNPTRSSAASRSSRQATRSTTATSRRATSTRKTSVPAAG